MSSLPAMMPLVKSLHSAWPNSWIGPALFLESRTPTKPVASVADATSTQSELLELLRADLRQPL
ncbi:MAG: hypothetical protein JWN52_1373 [Actinomycetia bacterium]|nr:hypothetical protein [Actinomycetes bacterium]